MYDEFYLTAYARQRKDVTQQQVRDEFVRVAQELATDHPDLNRERSADVELTEHVLHRRLPDCGCSCCWPRWRWCC